MQTTPAETRHKVLVAGALLLSLTTFAHAQSVEHCRRGTAAVLPNGAHAQIVELVGPDAAEVVSWSSVSSDRYTDLGIRMHADPISIIRATAERSRVYSLRLDGVPISNETLITIAQLCPDLEMLCLRNVAVLAADESSDLTDAERHALACSELTAESIDSLAGLHRLKYLMLDGIELSTGAIDRLPNLSNLVELAIENVGVSDETLRPIGQLSRLESLSLRGTKVHGNGLQHLEERCQRLHSLTLWETPVDQSLVEYFQRPHSLRLGVLDVSGCEFDEETYSALEDALPFTKVVRERVFSHTPVPNWLEDPQAIRRYGCASMQLNLQFRDDMVQTVADSESGSFIDRIVFSRNQAVEDWTLVYAGWIVSASYLGLRGAHFTNEGLSQLAELARLEQLDLAFTNVDDSGLQHLKSFPRLRVLDLTGTDVSDEGLDVLSESREIEMLFLSFTSITDTGVRHLSRFPQLRNTTLRACPISVASAQVLSEIEGLRTIDARNTVLTPDIVKQMVQVNPNLAVVVSPDISDDP